MKAGRKLVRCQMVSNIFLKIDMIFDFLGSEHPVEKYEDQEENRIVIMGSYRTVIASELKFST